jgi:hydroxyacyl-ACP dehydratase HTD2-like protein with hotdog domain
MNGPPILSSLGRMPVNNRMDPLDEVLTRAAELTGQNETEYLGAPTVKEFCRFAAALDDGEYIRRARDEHAAGRAVIAPPLFLVGIMGWGDGPAEAELHADGLPAGEAPCTQGLPVRHVHGGQSVRFAAPLTAGTELRAVRTLKSAHRKEGRSGEFVVLTVSTRYVTVDGVELADTDENVVVLPHSEEAASRGDAAPVLSKFSTMGTDGDGTYRHSHLQLFRFSAVSWNSHRIHYDADYARSEGFPDVVVQSTLHACTIVRHALACAGPEATLASVSWRNHATAVADEPLTLTATPSQQEGSVTLDASTKKLDGTPCTTATVNLLL